MYILLNYNYIYIYVHTNKKVIGEKLNKLHSSICMRAQF